MKRIGCSILTLIFVLTACGGRKATTLTLLLKKRSPSAHKPHVCRSERAANACGGASQDCSACDLESAS